MPLRPTSMALSPQQSSAPSVAGVNAATTPPVEASPAAGGSSAASSGVVINDVQLSGETLLSLRQASGTQIPDGEYWYDRISGVWGYAGGPAVGYTASGLDVGGPLRQGASNGHTNVVVNGRELHLFEVVALQQMLGEVYPGRYWLDSRGNYGYEGQGSLGNLWAIAQQSGGQRQGILSTYDKTGVAVIGGEVLERDPG